VREPAPRDREEGEGEADVDADAREGVRVGTNVLNSGLRRLAVYI
jgi:hypothetical protein